ncbi:hypothetical protein JX266_012593 [Neoarthrinium moseri]|nr:hypothetical protein JX266_012593 [Neoarthrinium moseri]
MERASALFFVELAPPSTARGARCQFVDCDKRIKEGDYRTAVVPGMNNVYQSPGADGPETKRPAQQSWFGFFKPEKPDGMTDFEYFKLCGLLTTIESDGIEDKEEWNLIDQFVPLSFDKLEDLNETDSLSSMLRTWNLAQVLVCTEEGRLTDGGKRLRAEVDGKAARAIRRLGSIPMPDFQSALFDRYYSRR